MTSQRQFRGQGSVEVKDLLTGLFKVAVGQQPQNLRTGEDFKESVEILDRIPIKSPTLEESELSVEAAEGDNQFNVVLE